MNERTTGIIGMIIILAIGGICGFCVGVSTDKPLKITYIETTEPDAEGYINICYFNWKTLNAEYFQLKTLEGVQRAEQILKGGKE